MGRIPEMELERIKAEVSIQRLAEARGVKLRRHGADLLGLCPFHDDREPSLVITPSKNLWHCLGACQAGGSVVDWVMRSERLSFRHAVELLRRQAGGPGTTEAEPGKRLELPPIFDPKADDGTLLRQALDFYHETLWKSPEALGYLERRGIGSRELIERFRLGFANRTIFYRLPPARSPEGASLRKRLQGLGLLGEGGSEHFNGSVVIPILGEDGEVLELYGRKIGARLRKDTPEHLYLPGPHRGVWNEAALVESKGCSFCQLHEEVP